MSSARFARLVQDAYTNNDITSARDAYHDYQCSHCLNPILQKVYDAHTQSYRTITINCGKCYHCTESKINEWCTRMYAHAEDFKNVYFVTLTYRSIVNPSVPVNTLLLQKLSGAVWNNDPFNFNHHLSYNPCLLCKEHYQKFLKRLRQYTGLNDLTYVLSGEYGHEFGRPHFHMVLFTNGTLTRADIVRAWSVALWKSTDGSWTYKTSQKHNGKAHYFPIGHVDFHDLVSNGTFNTTAKIKVDGTFMNASNCFSYVCKYVCKRDDANLNRVRLAFRKLFASQLVYKLDDMEIPKKELQLYCDLCNYNYQYISKNYMHYEKKIFQPCESIYQHGLLWKRPFKAQNVTFIKEIFPANYLDFCNLFEPFCEFSRGCPIGSVYANRNLPEFTQGVFTKPLLQESGFVVPTYFRNKAKEHVYGLREVRKTISGRSFALGRLVDLSRLFESGDFAKLAQTAPTYGLRMYTRTSPTLPKSSFEYVDKSTGEHIVLKDSMCRHYKFDRHLRKYVNTRNMTVPDFIRYWSSALKEEYKRYYDSVSRSKDNMRLTERAQLMLLDLGEEPETLRQRFINRTESERKERQKLYQSVHAFCE